MKSEVKEKLKIIADLYPPEEIEKRKERWRRMWTGEPVLDRYPFVFYPMKVDYYNTVHTKEERLHLFLDEFIMRGRLEEDFIPAFFPGCRQGTIPSMFGAKELIVQGDYTCEHVLNDVEDIDNIPDPEIREGTPAWEWLEAEKYYLEECEGQIPVHVCDMQGPMDVFGQLFGYDNVYYCAYEEEDRFHKMMNLLCEAFIKLWNTQKELCGDRFIGNHMYGWTWIPDNIAGASMSADSMAMMSRQFFDEYYKPYIEKLGKYFNGVVVHSCGDFSAVIPSLTAIPEVKAVNASQMTPQRICAAGWDKNKVIITKEDFEVDEGIFRYIKENNLRVELAVRECWQTEKKKGLAFDPDSWSEEYWKEVLQRNQKLVEWTSF